MVGSEHTQTSYPGLSFCLPGFSHYRGQEERRVQGLDYTRICQKNIRLVVIVNGFVAHHGEIKTENVYLILLQVYNNEGQHACDSNPDQCPACMQDECTDYRESFDNAKTMYQEALNKSGYNCNLSYNESRNEKQESRKNHPRNILWYNPPFSKNVKTNVGECFLSLDQHFPKSNPLHKILTGTRLN